jgi:hypothetical protein
MATVEMSAKPKRIKTFIINGQVYEGGATEYYQGTSKPYLGGARSSNSVEEKAGADTEKKAE